MISFALMSAALAASPETIVALDSVEHFTVDSPFDYPWMAGALPVQHGTLFVIEISPGTAHVAQVGGPVLYVGSTPAALTHPGTTDAHLVAFVPQHLDLSVTPVFWGPTDLPERVTQPMGQAALAQAAAKPFSTTQVQSVQMRKQHFSDEAALYGRIAELIEIHAPADSDFAHGYSLGANR
jgi:hypothetical protein